MRVLLDYRPALRFRTGVGEYAHQLAAALVGVFGTHDELVLFSSSWKDRLAPGTVPGAAVADARVPVRVLNFAWHRLEWPPVERLAGAVDVAHSMHPLMMPAREAARLITIHDLYFLDNPEGTAAEIRRDYPTLVARHARRADAVIVNSNYTAAQVQRRLDVDPADIYVCPPGAPSWRPRKAPVRGGHVLFIGTLGPRKNVGRLLRAYESLIAREPGLPPVVLAGRITTGSEPILAQLQRAPLSSRARHVGYVSDERREQLFREASVLVMPSYDEGFGIPALEAMAMGVPVVAANRGALPDLVEGAGLLVDPEDESSIADGIRRMLTDTAFADECARRGRARAAGFTWDASARRLAQAYASAAARRGDRRA